MRWNQNAAAPWLLLAPALCCIAAFVVLPIASIGAYSFWADTPTGLVDARFTLRNWQEFFGDPFYGEVLLKTLRLSLVTTLVCALVGYGPAYFLSRLGGRRRGLLIVLLFLPSWISYIVRTMSWLYVLGKTGLVNTLLLRAGLVGAPLPLLYNDFSIYLGLVHYLLPLMILNIYIGLGMVDRNLVDAARTLGAAEWQAFLSVTFPLSLPGLSAGALLCFILSAGTYVTPLILGGPGSNYYASFIYDTVISQADWPFGATLSLVFIALLAVALFGYGRLIGLAHMFQEQRA
jgi:spermidine/putrescine transport system permease protein